MLIKGTPKQRQCYTHEEKVPPNSYSITILAILFISGRKIQLHYIIFSPIISYYSKYIYFRSLTLKLLIQISIRKHVYIKYEICTIIKKANKKTKSKP